MATAAQDRYDLIAFDMDGTMLNERKELTPGVCATIERAHAAGKLVAIATGRCASEITPYLDQIPAITYAVSSSGSLLSNLKTNEVYLRHMLSPGIAKAAMEIIAPYDTMVMGVREGSAIARKSQAPRMAHWNMGQFQSLYYETGTLLSDEEAELLFTQDVWEKINVFFRTADDRAEAFAKLSTLPVSISLTETTALEFTPTGVDKASGLRELAKMVDVDLSRCIAVGDSNNDIAMIEEVGLGVAMANANDNVKRAAQAMVADCEHDGAAEAIDRFLLS